MDSSRVYSELNHIVDCVECPECKGWFVSENDETYCPKCVGILASQWRINDTRPSLDNWPHSKGRNFGSILGTKRHYERHHRKDDIYPKRFNPNIKPLLSEVSRDMRLRDFEDWLAWRELHAAFSSISGEYYEHRRNIRE